MSRVQTDYDLLVVGGGAVGAAVAALAVRLSGFDARRVAVVEQRPPAPFVPGADYDLRVVALSRASTRILGAAGAWRAIEHARVSPYERMRVWPADTAPLGDGAIVFDAADLGEANLGYIVESRLIQSSLLAELERLEVRVIEGGVTAIEFTSGLARVTVGDAPLTARLVIGADGARSRVRELAGLASRIQDYGQAALVANVATARPHESTAWQRFLGNGTLAFLPLADGLCSIVWSVASERAQALKEMPVEAFERELTAALDEALGAVTLRSARATYPLVRITAPRYVVERCALAGDAAHTVHPLAGQGVNLGFLDAAVLADELALARTGREDPGALRILRRYERARRPGNELMAGALDAFNGVLAMGSGPFAAVARRGLGWVNRSALLKRFFAGQALGTAGETPTAARLSAAE